MERGWGREIATSLEGAVGDQAAAFGGGERDGEAVVLLQVVRKLGGGSSSGSHGNGDGAETQ